MKMKKNQRGFVALLEMCLVMLILGILFAMSAPSISQMKIGADQKQAVSMLKLLSNSELYVSQVWSNGYRSPGVLAQVSFPAACDTPVLLGGLPSLLQPGAPVVLGGYTFTFSFVGAQVPLAPHCAVAGYAGYTISAIPTNPNNLRSLWVSSTDSGLVHYADSGTASVSSAVWSW
jgi:hypothetical protein